MNENLPLELFSKHQASLGLEGALVVDSDVIFSEKQTEPASGAVIFLPKSKALIDMTLAFVSSIVEKDGVIALVGEKKAGIESAKKLYEKNIGPVENKIIGKHSALYLGKNLNKKEFDFESFVTTSEIIYKDQEIKIAHLPGIFSAGTLDPGTKLLLDCLPIGAKKFLDLACGGGVVGTIYKKLSPETEITLSDSSLLAIESAHLTLALNGVQGEVIPSDIFSNLNNVFDVIAINPPFHKGIETNYSFIEKFSRDAAQYLLPDGKVFLVANTFLPYRTYLEQIGEVRVVSKDPQFTVYSVTRI